VRIEQLAEVPRPTADLVGGKALYPLSGGRCSIGFSARAGGRTYVITAGHCTEGERTFLGPDRTVLGLVDATAYPEDDFGVIRVTNSAWTGSGRISGSIPVRGSRAVAVGAAICRSGSVSGFKCGYVQARNVTVNYGDGEVVRGLTSTNACSVDGDSGGPFVAADQAQGVLSGGLYTCSQTDTSLVRTYFQPINEVLSRRALTLVVR
jgi:streptogrisin C